MQQVHHPRTAKRITISRSSFIWALTGLMVLLSTAPHSKFLIRWAHMVLTFAEAANHVTHDATVALIWSDSKRCYQVYEGTEDL